MVLVLALALALALVLALAVAVAVAAICGGNHVCGGDRRSPTDWKGTRMRCHHHILGT